VRQLVSTIYIIFLKNIIHLFLTQFYVINQLIRTIRTLMEVTGSLEVQLKCQGLGYVRRFHPAILRKMNNQVLNQPSS